MRTGPMDARREFGVRPGELSGDAAADDGGGWQSMMHGVEDRRTVWNSGEVSAR